MVSHFTLHYSPADSNITLNDCNRDSEWTRIQTTAARKTLLLGQIKMATHNLYALMYKHLQRKIPLTHEAEDTMLQLGKVCRMEFTHNPIIKQCAKLVGSIHLYDLFIPSEFVFAAASVHKRPNRDHQ